MNYALTVALRRAGLPHVRVHDLRHTTASVLLEAGTHPKIVQDLLGHSTIRLTLDTHSHLTPPLHRQAAQTMDLILAANSRLIEANSFPRLSRCSEHRRIRANHF
ncbi:MAG TPA: tyrosine-type recombinase/integrase [Candidatus Dormibacteraeota bacterium]|nr:tyrosine-type recombinase/integrase [Candidatus Dormibacteraeota bacterium]